MREKGRYRDWEKNSYKRERDRDKEIEKEIHIRESERESGRERLTKTQRGRERGDFQKK